MPEDANRSVWLRLQELKEPKTMSHVTFAEIYGREQGHMEGALQTTKESLRDLLLAKFPADGLALFVPFEQEQNLDRLKFLLRAAGLAQSPDDFRARIAPTS